MPEGEMIECVMPKRSAAERFHSWVVKHGGTVEAANLIGCSISFVSHIKSGQKKPGRSLASRIEKLTKIPVSAWDAA